MDLMLYTTGSDHFQGTNQLQSYNKTVYYFTKVSSVASYLLDTNLQFCTAYYFIFFSFLAQIYCHDYVLQKTETPRERREMSTRWGGRISGIQGPPILDTCKAKKALMGKMKTCITILLNFELFPIYEDDQNQD